MSGHSHWATIKHKKLASDARKGALFSKLARQLMVVAREGGADPKFNFALEKAMREAKQAGMPLDRIENAVLKGAGKVEGQELVSKLYEAKGPGGTMIIIETITDNSNRTSMEMRKICERNHGALIPPGTALNQFERKGFVYVKAEGTDENALTDAVIEAGGDNCERVGEQFEITCTFENFQKVLRTLQSKFPVESSETPWVPRYDNYIELSAEDWKKVERLVGELDDHDDVQNVHTNAKAPAAVSG